MNITTETIAAISTARGRSDRPDANLRRKAIQLADRIFAETEAVRFSSPTFNLGQIVDRDENVIDQVMIWSIHPVELHRRRLIEISGHGGTLVTARYWRHVCGPERAGRGRENSPNAPFATANGSDPG